MDYNIQVAIDNGGGGSGGEGAKSTNDIQVCMGYEATLIAMLD